MLALIELNVFIGHFYKHTTAYIVYFYLHILDLNVLVYMKLDTILGEI